MKDSSVADQQFANFVWEPRWNGASAVASVQEVGDDLFMVNCMGMLNFKREDKNVIANQLRRAAEMLEGLPD